MKGDAYTAGIRGGWVGDMKICAWSKTMLFLKAEPEK